jgi:HSP20 family molecular chaperone IbpA
MQDTVAFYKNGAFSRTTALPATVQVDKATAQRKEGVLEITLPRSAKAPGTEIPLQV